MPSPFKPSAGVAASLASISLSASSLHIAALAEAVCSASNMESHSSNRAEITSSIPAIFRVARNDPPIEAWRTLDANWALLRERANNFELRMRATHEKPHPTTLAGVWQPNQRPAGEAMPGETGPSWSPTSPEIWE